MIMCKDTNEEAAIKEPPPHLKFQRYQFANLSGRFRKRSYRSSLGVTVPKKVEDCHVAIRKMAQKLYMPNGSVDAVDLVQIGEMVFCEQVSRLGSSIIKRPEVALRILMEKIQWAMFHAIDQHLVSLPSQSNASTGEQGDDDFAAFKTQLFEAGTPAGKLQMGSTIANETLEDAEQDADLDIAPCEIGRAHV